MLFAEEMTRVGESARPHNLSVHTRVPMLKRISEPRGRWPGEVTLSLAVIKPEPFCKTVLSK